MGIRTTIGNVTRNFVDMSSWSISGGGEAWAEGEIGASAWAIGRVSFTIGVTPYAQVEVMNSASPKAGQIHYQGKYLPNWNRKYMLDTHEIRLNAGAGVSLVDSPLKPVINVSGDIQSHTYGFPILRHRANGAPPPRDSRFNYVAGDPTGFLGLGMSGAINGSARVGGAVNMSLINGKMFMLGSNFVQMARDLTQSSWRAAASRGLSMLLARNHLQFHFTGFQSTPGVSWELGTSVIEFASLDAEVSFGALFVSKLHLFIEHPSDGTWRYVYTRHLNLDLSFSQPYTLRYSGPRWDQSWI